MCMECSLYEFNGLWIKPKEIVCLCLNMQVPIELNGPSMGWIENRIQLRMVKLKLIFILN